MGIDNDPNRYQSRDIATYYQPKTEYNQTQPTQTAQRAPSGAFDDFQMQHRINDLPNIDYSNLQFPPAALADKTQSSAAKGANATTEKSKVSTDRVANLKIGDKINLVPRQSGRVPRDFATSFTVKQNSPFKSTIDWSQASPKEQQFFGTNDPIRQITVGFDGPGGSKGQTTWFYNEKTKQWGAPVGSPAKFEVSNVGPEGRKFSIEPRSQSKPGASAGRPETSRGAEMSPRPKTSQSKFNKPETSR